MKINRTYESNAVAFRYIKQAGLFYIAETEQMCMKLATGQSPKRNAVDLENGRLYWVPHREPVQPVDAELVVKLS